MTVTYGIVVLSAAQIAAISFIRFPNVVLTLNIGSEEEDGMADNNPRDRLLVARCLAARGAP